MCPYLYYDNAKAAKDWMVDVLGFEAGFSVEDKDGTIRHAGRPEDDPKLLFYSCMTRPHRSIHLTMLTELSFNC